MRTTITLDPDTLALLQRYMKQRKVSMKQAVNDAIRAGLVPGRPAQRFRTEAATMGIPSVSLDGALRVAADLEDEEIVRKSRLRK